jgi:hypothetical protein
MMDSYGVDAAQVARLTHMKFILFTLSQNYILVLFMLVA